MTCEPTIVLETKEQFDQFVAEENPCILYFSSTNCNVCHSIFPKLMNIVEAYPIKVGRINVDKLLEIAGQYLVFTVPTILIMHEGKEVLRESRFINFESVERMFDLLTN